MEDPRAEMRRRRLLRERQLENVGIEARYKATGGRAPSLRERLLGTAFTGTRAAEHVDVPILLEGVGVVGYVSPPDADDHI